MVLVLAEAVRIGGRGANQLLLLVGAVTLVLAIAWTSTPRALPAPTIVIVAVAVLLVAACACTMAVALLVVPIGGHPRCGSALGSSGRDEACFDAIRARRTGATVYGIEG